MVSQHLHQIRANKFHSSKMVTVPDFNYHIIAGNAYHCWDSTANIGAETTPADTIEIYFTTPAATEKLISAFIDGFCSTAAAVMTFREAYTGGGDATGDAVTALNINRRSSNTSAIASSLKKQADAITSGGTVLWTEILTAGKKAGQSSSMMLHPFLLKAATKYGISVYLAGAGVANVSMHWFEQ